MTILIIFIIGGLIWYSIKIGFNIGALIGGIVGVIIGSSIGLAGSGSASNGWIILRFTDKELNDHPQDVLNVIMQAIRKKTGVSQNSNPEEETI